MRFPCVLVFVTCFSFCCQAFVVSSSGGRRPFSDGFRSMSTPQAQLPMKRKMSSSPEVNSSSMVERTQQMEERAKNGQPLSDTELDEIIQSIQKIAPDSAHVDYDKLRTVLSETAHLSHKDWDRTSKNAARLGEALLPDGISSSEGAQKMLNRIFVDGNWKNAEKHGRSIPESEHPWAVLVTGVNGIRKTTSVYQPWFPALLEEALVAPKNMEQSFRPSEVPVGSNSFFRQLDHMIAALCNVDFSQLYSLTEQEMGNDDEDPSPEVVKRYSDLKAAIFTRYRTLSEFLGILLLNEAQRNRMNCMMETSGRDVAMFHYVDFVFNPSYNKLVLHFVVNDLSCAKTSVDMRMIKEMKAGIAALKEGSAENMIKANAGGPYGSDVLDGVQEASDKVWNEVVLKNDGVGKDWYKATIAINAHPTEPWTAQAIRPDGTRGKLYTFENKV